MSLIKKTLLFIPLFLLFSCKNSTEEKHFKKKSTNTIIILNFNDLSHKFSYQIKDTYFQSIGSEKFALLQREINIFDKKKKLVQTIIPSLKMTPWYFPENKLKLRLSRSYLTGKNENFDDLDNYCGEIVVADFNFDGKEDFATPIDQGASNGPHYAFYIQENENHFNLNSHLTNMLIWFPEKIDNDAKTLTNEVPSGVYAINRQVFNYSSNTKTWTKIENLLLDVKSGKPMSK